MAQTPKSYIEEEIIWYENRIKEIKQDIDDHPYDEIRDRIVSLDTPRGSAEKVVATEEQQKTAQRAALKEYGALIEVLDKLREREAAKVEVRGNAQLSTLAKGFLEGGE